MVEEGELKKRIAKSFQGWIGAVHSDYIQGKNDGRTEVLQWIDEAKQEFPDFAKLTNIVVSEFEIEAQKWFVKWFGRELSLSVK